MLALLLMLLLPFIGKIYRLHYFMPVMVIAVYQSSLSRCLWLAIVCGISTALFSKADWMGIYALANMCAIALIGYYKRYFFSDSFSTLPVLTAIGACVSSIVTAVCIVLLDKAIILSAKLIFYDAVLMSLLDGFYALVIFTLPAFIAQYYSRQRIIEE